MQRPDSARLTLGPGGANALLFFAASWIAALLTGGAMTLVPATLGVLFLLTALRVWRSARNLQIALPNVVRARAGRGGSVLLTITNHHQRLALERVEARAGEGLARSRHRSISTIGPGQVWRGKIPFRFEGRGLHSTMAVDLHTTAPLGLLALHLSFVVETEVIVGPALTRLRGYQPPPSRSIARRHPESGVTRGQEEPAGLRPWRPGEGEARVHWRSSARLGRRVVREFENHDEAPIELHLVTPDEEAGGAFEQAIELTAALLEELPRQGRRMWFRIDEEMPRSLHSHPARMRALDLLAELPQHGARTPSIDKETPSPRTRRRTKQSRPQLVVSLDAAGEPILDGARVKAIHGPLGGRVFEVQGARTQRERRTR